jgi:hypothetical protein
MRSARYRMVRCDDTTTMRFTERRKPRLCGLKWLKWGNGSCVGGCLHHLNNLAEELGGTLAAVPDRPRFFRCTARFGGLCSATHPRRRSHQRQKPAGAKACVSSFSSWLSIGEASRQVGMPSLVRMRSRTRRSELRQRRGKWVEPEVGARSCRKGVGVYKRLVFGADRSVFRCSTNGKECPHFGRCPVPDKRFPEGGFRPFPVTVTVDGSPEADLRTTVAEAT